MAFPPRHTRPSRGRSSRLIARSTVDFPAPLGPTMQVMLPARTCEIKALQDVATAVAGNTTSRSIMRRSRRQRSEHEVVAEVRLEHGRSELTVAGWPAAIPPAASTITRSESEMTKCMSCSTIRNVRPDSLSALISTARRRTSVGLIPAGSSSRITFGIEHQHLRELDQLALPVRQVRRPRADVFAHPDELQQFGRPRPRT